MEKLMDDLRKCNKLLFNAKLSKDERAKVIYKKHEIYKALAKNRKV